MNLADTDRLQEYLKQHNLSAKKALGQNFLVDEEALAAILHAAELTNTDHVLEVGPGPGTLTRQLAQHAGSVTAVEKDRDMIGPLKQSMSAYPDFVIIEDDVMNVMPPAEPYKLVANIPYYLTSPILRHFLSEATNRPARAVLLVQKEVAEKICAEKKTVLGWQVAVFGTPEIVRLVPRSSFLPAPKVDSAVLKIIPHAEPLLPLTEIPEFFDLLYMGFRAPRKKIGGSLAAGLPAGKAAAKEMVEKGGIDAEKRPGDLSFGEWQALLGMWGKA